jgi:hypothetical protein
MNDTHVLFVCSFRRSITLRLKDLWTKIAELRVAPVARHMIVFLEPINQLSASSPRTLLLASIRRRRGSRARKIGARNSGTVFRFGEWCFGAFRGCRWVEINDT